MLAAPPSEPGATGAPRLGTAGSGKSLAQDLASTFTHPREEQVLIWLGSLGYLLHGWSQAVLDSSLL